MSVHRMTTTEINVPIHIVWEYLSDLERWDQWNPCVRFSADLASLGGGLEESANRTSRRRKGKAKLVMSDTKAISSTARRARRKCPTTQNPSMNQDSKKRFADCSGRQTWLLVDCTLEHVSRQDFVVSWTTYRGMLKNTTVMHLSPLGTKRTLLKHTQTIRGPKLAAKLLGMDKHGQSLLTSSVCVDQSLKNHVESQYFQTLLTDLSTSLPHISMAKYLSNTSPPSPTSNTKGGKCVKFATFHNDSSTTTMKTEQCSSDFWHSPEHLRNAVVSQFFGDDVDLSGRSSPVCIQDDEEY